MNVSQHILYVLAVQDDLPGAVSDDDHRVQSEDPVLGLRQHRLQTIQQPMNKLYS